MQGGCPSPVDRVTDRGRAPAAPQGPYPISLDRKPLETRRLLLPDGRRPLCPPTPPASTLLDWHS